MTDFTKDLETLKQSMIDYSISYIQLEMVRNEHAGFIISKEIVEKILAELKVKHV
jgi:hypothetical protein